jgi:hypothetical protein
MRTPMLGSSTGSSSVHVGGRRLNGDFTFLDLLATSTNGLNGAVGIVHERHGPRPVMADADAAEEEES